MSKSVVLVLKPNHESEYGEYANIPAFNAHGDIIGWTGGEVPESGHTCEFNVLNDEGFTTCASSTTVNKLRGENAKLRELVRRWYPHMLKRVGRDALEQWGQMDVVKELGIEEEPHVDD